MTKKDILRSLFKGLLYIPIFIVVYVRNKIHARRKGYHKAKTKDILDGFANLAFENPKIERLIKIRAELCGECPESVPIGVVNQAQTNGEVKPIRGMKCKQCGCLLSAKVRSLESYCPLGKW